MGEWDRMYGCGYPVESFLASIDSSWEADQRAKAREAREKWWDKRTAFGRTKADLLIEFSNYNEMKRWDQENPGVEYIREPWGTGFVMKVTGAPDGWSFKKV